MGYEEDGGQGKPSARPTARSNGLDKTNQLDDNDVSATRLIGSARDKSEMRDLVN